MRRNKSRSLIASCGKSLGFSVVSAVVFAFVVLSRPVFAIVPPSDEEAERLRTAPDLQQRIDRANWLLDPLLNPANIRPTAVAERFSENLGRKFGLRAGEEGFHTRYDINRDEVIDERDFVELAFQSPAVMRQACRSPKFGDAECIVLPIKFPDVSPKPEHHSDYWQNMFFGETTYTTHSFYRQVSNGALNLGGDVLTNPEEADGYWMASNPKTTYDFDMALLEEVLDMADEVYDFSEYDADGNQEADGVYFIYAGDTDGWGDFYWGWAWYGPWIVDGVRVGPLMFVGENLMTYRVAAHEYGHMMGLPDLYDYTFASAGVGVWALMGKGEAYMCAWSRYKLGWVDPITPGIDIYDVPFTPRSQNGDVYRLWHLGEYGPQYFLLEMVEPSGYDYQLPGGGLMIWHVDDTMSNNNNWKHKLVDVEEADGKDDMDHLVNWGDATDPYFPGNNDTFNHESYPNSDAYDGSETLVQVINISTASGDLTADLLIGIPGDLEVDEIEPNNKWNDSGVITIPPPNGIPEGKVDSYTDPSDFWRFTVFKPCVVDATLNSLNDTVDLSLICRGPGGSGPIEIADTTWADEHLRAYVFIPGNHFLEVRAERQAAYYELVMRLEELPEPGEIEVKCFPLLPETVFDKSKTIPAMRIDILNNAGSVTLNDLQMYTQGTYPSCIEGIKLWLDNGDEVFGPGLDTVIYGPVGTDITNRIILSGLDLPISHYAVLFATIDIAEVSGGETVGLSVQSYKDTKFSGGAVIYPNFPLDSGVAEVIRAPMPLCYVTGSDFVMGSDPENDPYYTPLCDYNEETPPHKNRTGDYYISRYEITNSQYGQFMADGGYDTQSYWVSGGWSWKNDNEITAPEGWNDGEHYIGDAYPDYPVGGVSWYEAAAYARYAGARLPHETEWEKSGRGTDALIYTYGNVFDSSAYAAGEVEPVGGYPQSDSLYGVSDLCGNIFEWTLDSWEYGLYDRYASGIFNPPTGGSYRQQRGYRWLVVGDCGPDYATRLSYRDTWPRTYRWTFVGFRVVFDSPS